MPKESRMKRPIFIMLVLVAIAFAGPLLIKKPDGTAFMALPFTEGSGDSSIGFSANGSSQSFYKWQDDDGSWHYSDEAPAGKTVETVTVNTNTNLIQGLKTEKDQVDKTDRVSEIKNNTAVEETSAIPLPMTVPIEKVTDMLKDAHNIQHIMDSRSKQIDQAVDGR